MIVKQAEDYPAHYATITFDSYSDVDLVVSCMHSFVLDSRLDLAALQYDLARIIGVLENTLVEVADNASDDS